MGSTAAGSPRRRKYHDDWVGGPGGLQKQASRRFACRARGREERERKREARLSKSVGCAVSESPAAARVVELELRKVRAPSQKERLEEGGRWGVRSTKYWGR